MPVKGFETISLKTEVVQWVKEYIKNHPEQGYKSVADFVTDAIRTKLNAALSGAARGAVE